MNWPKKLQKCMDTFFFFVDNCICSGFSGSFEVVTHAIYLKAETCSH